MAFLFPFALLAAPFVKKETVSGIIGNTQGVRSAIRPPKKPRTNTSPLPESSFTCSVPQSTKGFLKSRLFTLIPSVLTGIFTSTSAVVPVSVIVVLAGTESCALTSSFSSVFASPVAATSFSNSKVFGARQTRSLHVWKVISATTLAAFLGSFNLNF